jgi:hypothetical protein
MMIAFRHILIDIILLNIVWQGVRISGSILAFANRLNREPTMQIGVVHKLQVFLELMKEWGSEMILCSVDDAHTTQL